MDCEGLQTKKIKGPTSLKASAEAIERFAEILEQHDIIGEFFITPEAVRNHATLFKSLNKKHNLSLHLHLGAYKNGNYFGQGIELANLSKQKQKEVLKTAILEFENTLQLKPFGFRPGMGSANLDTIELLSEFGINHGSLSIPEHQSKKYNYDWIHWSTIPHTIETLTGNFRNLPLTGNLKLENLNKSTLLDQAVENLIKLNYVAVYTHNWVDFSKDTDVAELLNNLITKLKGLT